MRGVGLGDTDAPTSSASSQASGSPQRDNWPTLAEGTHLLTSYLSAPRKGLHCSNPQLKLGGMVPRGLSVLTIEHSEQRLKAGS